MSYTAVNPEERVGQQWYDQGGRETVTITAFDLGSLTYTIEFDDQDCGTVITLNEFEALRITGAWVLVPSSLKREVL